jgi:hypothetical protein
MATLELPSPEAQTLKNVLRVTCITAPPWLVWELQGEISESDFQVSTNRDFLIIISPDF